LPLLLPNVPAGSTGAVPIQITASTDTELRVWSNPCYFRSPLSAVWDSCLDAFGAALARKVEGGAFGVVVKNILPPCAAAISRLFHDAVIDVVSLVRDSSRAN